MEILIFSDSHGRPRGMTEAFSRCTRRQGAIFFLGDGLRDLDAISFGDTPVYAVRGNCDWYSPVPEEGITALAGHTILFAHGHRYGVKSGYGGLIRRAAEVGADLALFGHTHRSDAETIPAGEVIGGIRLARPLYLFNPGSIGSVSDGGYSYGTLFLDRETVLFSHGRI